MTREGESDHHFRRHKLEGSHKLPSSTLSWFAGSTNVTQNYIFIHLYTSKLNLINPNVYTLHKL